MQTYVNPFTNQTVSPAQVGYIELTIATDTPLQWPINGNNSENVAANIIEVIATATNLKLLMPPAPQVSTGQAVIVRNIGTNPFTVTTTNGTTITTIPSGVAEYIYLSDNTTVDGVWALVTFGAGTSSANASELAGYGLIAINTTLNQEYVVQEYYGTSLLTDTARAQMNVWLGGAGALTLPSTALVGANWFTIIKNDGTGILDVLPSGDDNVDGEVATQLQIGESFVVVSNGTNWYTFAYGRSNQFVYTQFSAVVTGGTLVLNSTQAANTIQVYSGILTSNQTIVVPATVQLYTVRNNTTGAYSFTVKTTAPSGATVTVPQGSSLVIISDGINVYNAASGSSSNIESLTVGNGSLATPSIKFASDLGTGIYNPSSGTVAFVANGVQSGSIGPNGLVVVNGIRGGGF